MTIIVIGGLHGDERSAWIAAKNLSQWPGAHTILIDNPALYTRTREIPGKNGKGEDLNRFFTYRIQGLPESLIPQGKWSIAEKLAHQIIKQVDTISLSPRANLPVILVDLHSAPTTHYNHPHVKMSLRHREREAVMGRIASKIPVCVEETPKENSLRWYYEQRGSERVIPVTLEAGGGGVVHRECVDVLVGAVKALLGEDEHHFLRYGKMVYEEMDREATVFPDRDLVRNAVQGADVSNYRAATVEMKNGQREERVVTGKLLGSYLFEDGEPDVLEKEDWICHYAQ